MKGFKGAFLGSIILTALLCAATIEYYPTHYWFTEDMAAIDTTRTLKVAPVGYGADSVAIRQYGSTTAADTFTTKAVAFDEGGGDVTFYLRKDGATAGADSLIWEVGLLLSDGVGVQWDTAATMAATRDTASYSVAQQGWGPYLIGNTYLHRFTEQNAQRYYFDLTGKHYRVK